MRVLRTVIVFDARDVAAESAFWAGMLGGEVIADGAWHSIVVDGEWVAGVQHAPNHVPPQWPDGAQQQQVHLDLHVDDLDAAGRLAESLGGRCLVGPRPPADAPDGDERFATYASPNGHPLDLGWHPA